MQPLKDAEKNATKLVQDARRGDFDIFTLNRISTAFDLAVLRQLVWKE